MDCAYLAEMLVARIPFAADAARLVAGREMTDEALAEVGSRHLMRLADGGEARRKT